MNTSPSLSQRIALSTLFAWNFETVLGAPPWRLYRGGKRARKLFL